MTEERRQEDAQIKALHEELTSFANEMRENHKENRKDIRELQDNWNKITWGYRVFLWICAGTAALITLIIKIYGFMENHWKS